MTSPNRALEDELQALLDKKPELVPPPDSLWESIHATWTGLWTDWHGEWDERQASDIFPISDRIYSQARCYNRANAQWRSIIKEQLS